ncbi:phosphate ABC transporter permease subunit PstC [Bacillus sp. CGMCC 1.16607]|uniref:phosphate ABC transporter permease subunit PstC n=1 Tax=Bacillus sp. CGMCC 1.16607 TaxID=3351842 RepID=UPI0036334CD8
MEKVIIHSSKSEAKKEVIFSDRNRIKTPRIQNKLFHFYTLLSACLLGLILVSILFFIGKTGFLVFQEVSFKEFFLSLSWEPYDDQFGAGIFIIGTFSLTLLTLLIAIPTSLVIAIFSAEMAPLWLKSLIRPVLDLLVGIPSIVYGYLGLTILVPLIRDLTGATIGEGFLPAAIVLSTMVLPTIARISDDAITSVPKELREASYALGSTRIQLITKVILPAAKSGIITAIILGMARAIGETMAVVMVIGNTAILPKDLYSPTSVLTSNIVMEILNVQFDSTWNYALYMMAFLLLLISLVLIMIIRKLRVKGV